MTAAQSWVRKFVQFFLKRSVKRYRFSADQLISFSEQTPAHPQQQPHRRQLAVEGGSVQSRPAAFKVLHVRIDFHDFQEPADDVQTAQRGCDLREDDISCD